MIRLPLRTLTRDQRGATAVEFGLTAPVLIMAMMGIFDLGHNMYTAQMLQGAIQEAARDATIEGAGAHTGDLDNDVRRAVHQIAPGATLTFTRKNYASFSDGGRPEDYTDVNGNSSCDAGEPFEDSNGNGTYDTDRGKSGVGGARDAVIYKVDISYERAFPIAGFLGQSNTYQTSAKTILRNQPFDAQGARVPVTGNCA